MVHKHCAWGTCNSDSKYHDRDYMAGIVFYKFPKPKIDEELCREWISACGRPNAQLNVEIIKEDYQKRKYYYQVCSKVSMYFI